MRIPKQSSITLIILMLGTFVIPPSVWSQQKDEIIVEYKDSGEVDGKGFTLTRDTEITISGSGVLFDTWDDNQGFYGWILNSDTREVVWNLLESRKYRRELRRERLFNFDEKITLPKGNYEVYYGGVYHGNNDINDLDDLFRAIFDWDRDDLPRQDKRQLKMVISASRSNLRENNVEDYVNRLSDKAVVSCIQARNNENFEKRFSLTDDTRLHIYAYAEGRDGNLYDYAWIYDVRKNKKVWDINRDNAEHGGGGEKNIVVDEEIELPEGSYTVHYVSDDSHSYQRWNTLPPDDPQFWGITIWAASADDRRNIVSFREADIVKPIVELTRIRDDETVSQGITLDRPMNIRILCVGEGTHEMVDYGWIINADTRKIAWEMKERYTEHAGGADKNRMLDETVHFDKGSYIVYYTTDDSHSYHDWNASPPFNQERWGITIWLDDERDRNDVQYFNDTDFRSKNVLAEITRVRNDEYLRKPFILREDTRVRIIALGEGRHNEMFDYGWIRDDDTGDIVWEMTYRRTHHAGGASKNRVFNDTIFLHKGHYVVYYETDDSHSYHHWNSTPPRDKEQYGITIIKER